MTLSIHQNTSAAAGYRKSLEGWAKAGIKYVEPTGAMLDEFLKTDTLTNAKRVLADNGLTISCGAQGVGGGRELGRERFEIGGDAALDASGLAPAAGRALIGP